MRRICHQCGIESLVSRLPINPHPKFLRIIKKVPN